jgi:hypothetical protein
VTTTLERLARALDGEVSNGQVLAPGPGHSPKDRSLAIKLAPRTPEGFLVHSFAGDDALACRDYVRARLGLPPWKSNGGTHAKPRSRIATTYDYADEAGNLLFDRRTEAALAIWQASRPTEGTLVEIYLHSRGLALPLPLSIRFHARLKHPSGSFWPVMVALVTCSPDGKPIGIHRTFLASDGNGKAPVAPEKMMLGPCRGGAVRLAQHRDVLMVGEGIETCLAAMQASGHAAWAALSTSGLRNLDLPCEVHDAIVLADGDDPGEAAAQDCAWRWKREGRRVRIARPPKGMDFNDLLVRDRRVVEDSAR